MNHTSISHQTPAGSVGMTLSQTSTEIDYLHMRPDNKWVVTVKVTGVMDAKTTTPTEEHLCGRDLSIQPGPMEACCRDQWRECRV